MMRRLPASAILRATRTRNLDPAAGQPRPPARGRGSMTLPAELRGVVPAETAATWVAISDVVPAEEGIALALRKYRPRAAGAFVESVVRGLSYLDDVDDDPAVPISRAEDAAYWRSRVPEIARSLSRLG